MNREAVLLETLRRADRPDRARLVLVRAAMGFDLAVLAVPVMAVGYRLAFGRPEEPIAALLDLLCVALLVVACFMSTAFLATRRDVLAAARRADALGDGDERHLTAAEMLLADARPRFRSLVVARSIDDMTRIAPMMGARRVPWRGISVSRAVIATLLAVAILLVPAAPRGLLGADRSRPGAEAAGAGAGETARGAGEGVVIGTDDFAARVEVTTKTDKAVYLIGEEIPLVVSVRTLDSDTGGVALEAAAIVNGEHVIELPVDWVLPAEPDQVLRVEIPMRERLERAGLYKSGLVTFDVHVRPKEERPGLGGAAAANRWTIQVTENTNRLRTPTPAPVVPPQKKPKAEPERKQQPKEKKPEEPRSKERPRPGTQGEPPPAGEIESKPFVVDPLFSSDETKKRDVRVFDRDRIDAAPNPASPMPSPIESRGYERLRLAAQEKPQLDAAERASVRRYLDLLLGEGGGR